VVGGEAGGSTLGAIMLAVIASAAFAAILSTVSGLVIASSSSLAHDLYNSVIRHGKATEREEVGVAKLASIGIGIVAIVLAIFAQNLNVAFLVGLAFAVAASANLPTLLLSLFWKRFNTNGALWGIYGGLIASLLLVVFSPVFSGAETSLLTGVDIAWFPMSNPGLVSIPLGLLCAVVGTLMSDESRTDRYATLQVRALTGAGSERAVVH
jgi:cation/acetate symporter